MRRKNGKEEEVSPSFSLSVFFAAIFHPPIFHIITFAQHLPLARDISPIHPSK